MTRTILALMILGICATAHAKDVTPNKFWTAAEWAKKCKSNPKTGIDVLNAGMCVSYAAGVRHGFEIWENVDEKNAPVCVPKGITNERMVDIVLAYLRANPDEREQPAGMVIGYALVDTWPCSDKNRRS